MNLGRMILYLLLPNEVKFLMPSRYEAIDQHTVFPGGYLLVKPDMTNRDGDFLPSWREIELYSHREIECEEK